MNRKIVTFNDIKYSVFNIKKNTPVIVNDEDYNYISKLNKKWNINDNGFVYCRHVLKNGEVIDVYLHEIIMARKNEGNILKKPIIHINRLGIDNRWENLMYDTTNKDIHKNISKKQRIIKLPKSCGIKPNELPSFVWYLKPDSSHGDRFMVQVGDISWKTTSSTQYSLRYKLEEAKKYLRNLKETRPEIFDKFGMNGGYNKDGKNLLESFYKILDDAGYKKIKKITTDFNDDYLKLNTNGLAKDEIELLEDN